MDKGERGAAQPGETDRRRPDKQTGDKLGRPFRRGGPGGPGRKAGVPNKATVVVKEIARELTLGNPVVVARLKKDAEAGTMPPRVFVELLHYGFGVPKETVALERGGLGFQIVLTGPPHDPLAEPVRPKNLPAQDAP